MLRQFQNVAKYCPGKTTETAKKSQNLFKNRYKNNLPCKYIAHFHSN